MSNKSALKRFTMATLPFFFATGSLAVNAQDKEVDEEVLVTGFRQSLGNAVDAKRIAKNITDNIYAEDIGKSADQNIAEALSRVTGISLNRTDGEGTSVSIRGAAPNLNNISVNGIALTSGSNPASSGAGASQDIVDLSAFSSDILSRVEVYKTASADLDEGSLGGSVILHTLRPLDIAENRRVLEIQPRYSDFSGETDYKLSGGISQKFADDTFGVHATLYTETQTVRRDEVEVSRFKNESIRSDQVLDQNGNSLQYIVKGEDEDGNPTESIGNINGVSYDSLAYRAYYNERSRIGGTLGLQFAPTDNTNMQFDLTHSTQTILTDNNKFTISAPTSEEFKAEVLGPRYGGGKTDWMTGTGTEADPYKIIGDLPEASDPLAQWSQYNTDTGMFTKRIGRYSQTGRTGRDTSEVETDNTIMSFDIEHRLDTLTFNFKAGYSKTQSKDGVNANITTNNYRTKSNVALAGVSSSEIQPIGYDCSTGKCKIITGTSIVDPGPDGDIFTTGDNLTKTAVNPDDVRANHLQAASTRDQSVTDEAKSLFFDVDWDISSGGITTLEAGLKWSDREKENIHGYIQYETNKQTGGTATWDRNVADVRVEEVQEGNTANDGFLSGLGYAQDNVTNGWPAVNAQKAFDIIGLNDVNPSVDVSNSRTIGVKSTAAYVKANFEFFAEGSSEQRLYGDIGLRYVNTENESSGYSGIDYVNNGILDIPTMLILQDKANPVCQSTAGLDPLAPDRYGKNNDDTKAIRAARAAELAQAPCYDSLMAALDRGANWGVWPEDETVNNPSFDEQFPSKGKGGSDILLPSLNLNYDIRSDLVMRFAVSKTMARPTMDSLQPGFKLSENVWGATGSGNIRNPDLKPLESQNLDIGLEWYFNESGGLLSATYFHKDYTNFEETETVSTFMRDARGEDLSGGGTADDFLTQSNDPDVCFPNRPHFWSATNTEEERSAYVGQCRELQVSKIVNGKGASVDGLEFGYQQNYDFLPSVWGGLGTAINFTYQKTKTDKQEGTVKGTTLPDLPLAYSPEESLNATIFWEQNGHLVRLAYNYSSDVLVSRSWLNGMALWQEGGGTLDLSANYQVNDMFSITFNAVNLTDKIVRQYATSVSNTRLNDVLDNPNGEGSAFAGATKERTIREYNTGTLYRLGLRFSF